MAHGRVSETDIFTEIPWFFCPGKSLVHYLQHLTTGSLQGHRRPLQFDDKSYSPFLQGERIGVRMKTFLSAITSKISNNITCRRHPEIIRSQFEHDVPVYEDESHSPCPDKEETFEYPVEAYPAGYSAVDCFCRLKQDVIDGKDTAQCEIDEEETNLVPQEIAEETLQNYLAGVEFFLKREFYTDAEKLTQILLQRNPHHPVLLDKLSLIADLKNS